MSTGERSLSPVPGRERIQQAVHDLRRAEGLLLDFLEQHGLRISRVGAVEQHLREARDSVSGVFTS